MTNRLDLFELSIHTERYEQQNLLDPFSRLSYEVTYLVDIKSDMTVQLGFTPYASYCLG